MNKRYVPIIAFTLAVLLVSSVAYAAEKKKKARPAGNDPNEMSEEAFKVELLAANDEQHAKTFAPKAASADKSAEAAKEKIK
jgi:hypothetical protein